jgi:hypothetical protein
MGLKIARTGSLVESWRAPWWGGACRIAGLDEKQAATALYEKLECAVLPLYYDQATLALDDEADDRQHRVLLQQPSHDAPLRDRGLF